MDPGLVEKQDIPPMASGGQLIIQLFLHRDHCVPIVPAVEHWSVCGGPVGVFMDGEKNR